jgi:hypothetical protein
MLALPEEHRVNHPARPLSRALFLPAPRVSGKGFVGPRFFAEGAGHEDISQLVKRNRQLVKVMP